MDKEFDYTICQDNNPEEFVRICKLINTTYPEFKMNDLLVDADGSTIQIFENASSEVIIYDDYEIGAVFIKSDIDLSKLFDINLNQEMIA